MSGLELILVAVWSFIVSFFGGMVGMVLGNLRLPLIVLVGSSAAAAMPAAYLGARFTRRLDEHQVLRAISAILVVSGTAMAIQAIVG